MPKWARQLGTSVVLVALAASAWSQTPHYTVPAASLGDDFSAYHQALDSAADSALANLMRQPSASTIAVKTIAPTGATALYRFAEQYWNGNDEAVRRAVARVTQLRPILTPILREQGIPDEVAALVLVESAGQLTALSPKGARGIWQFMPDTARRYGLTVNGETDDRLDVQKSTRAAARYLRDLDARFGDWSLALAAYNVGETSVQNALLRSGNKDFAFLSRMRLIPAETRAYVSAVIAAARLFAPNDLFGDSSTQMRRSEVILNARSTTEIQQ